VVNVEQAQELTSAIVVYPNPASDRIRLQSKYPLLRDARIELVSSIGQIVYAKAIGDIPFGRTITVETSQLADGSYTLRLVSEEVNETQVVVIRH